MLLFCFTKKKLFIFLLNIVPLPYEEKKGHRLTRKTVYISRVKVANYINKEVSQKQLNKSDLEWDTSTGGKGINGSDLHCKITEKRKDSK
jgi:hypothetical protein